jgi:N-methylhydantoinase A/oxoprolinase/acetone carboxylase beta subunit
MFNFKKNKKEPENIKDIIFQFKSLEKKFDEISKELIVLKEKNQFAIQKFGISRFNPFREVGGDQSFTVVFLDENDNGAIITSHYTREGNRVYGKPIKKGKSEYLLSEEEIKTIEKAQNSNILTVPSIKEDVKVAKKTNKKKGKNNAK